MSSECYRIAVLEDNLPDLMMLKSSIREAGIDCEIVSFPDGAEALAYVNAPTSAVPDLMILDFNVPMVEGATVLNYIRGNTRWAHVGVFMFSGSHDPGDMARVKMLGANAYLVKPMDVAGFAKIGHAVRDWLETSRKQRSTAG
jgi:two-component system response regulator